MAKLPRLTTRAALGAAIARLPAGDAAAEAVRSQGLAEALERAARSPGLAEWAAVRAELALRPRLVSQISPKALQRFLGAFGDPGDKLSDAEAHESRPFPVVQRLAPPEPPVAETIGPGVLAEILETLERIGAAAAEPAAAPAAEAAAALAKPTASDQAPEPVAAPTKRWPGLSDDAAVEVMRELLATKQVSNVTKASQHEQVLAMADRTRGGNDTSTSQRLANKYRTKYPPT